MPGEQIFKEFNRKQATNPTIRECFHKCGQDIFSDDLSAYTSRIEKLSDVALYKSLTACVAAHQEDLLESHTAAIQEDLAATLVMGRPLSDEELVAAATRTIRMADGREITVIEASD